MEGPVSVCMCVAVQRHLSNRERKAQAKADRKERRREQHRGGDKVTDEFDPVGAMAV